VFTVSNDCPETDLDDPQPKRLKQLTLPFGRPNVSVIRPGKAGSGSSTLSICLHAHRFVNTVNNLNTAVHQFYNLPSATVP
jgi:hypothetical protein